ncbi:hypothetical protein, partial [Bifidobacterium pseudocatenulatum]|uniref:hypothetical protein n=1 Tax=Bifidobacterium pseudocatenulatum TaxID=28026 RepID=UPI0031F07356
ASLKQGKNPCDTTHSSACLNSVHLNRLSPFPQKHLNFIGRHTSTNECIPRASRLTKRLGKKEAHQSLTSQTFPFQKAG